MTDSDPTDAELIAASWEDPDAFEAVFDRHFDAIFRYFCVRVGQDDAQDLAAEVFTRAFQGRRSYLTDIRSARPWLLGIAANLLRKRARRRHRGRTALVRLELQGAPEPDPADEIAERVDAARLAARLASAFRSLTPEEQDVIGRHVFGGLTQQELAQSLGIPVGTVKSRLFRARGRLREHLGPLRGISEVGEPPGGAEDGHE